MAEVTSVKDLATLSKGEILTFLNSFDTIMSDCDGVLWMFGNPISGSPQTFNKLINLGKKIVLMTNNAIIHMDQYVMMCQKLKLPIGEEDIFSPAVGITTFLKSHDLEGKKVYVVGPQALLKHLREKGIQCCETGVTFVEETLVALLAELDNLEPDVGAVVLDADVNLSYLKMMKCVAYLKNPECLFVVGAVDDTLHVRGGDYIPGPGLFVSLVERQAGRKATVVGKPSTYMTDTIVKDRSLDPARVLFIGDSITISSHHRTSQNSCDRRMFSFHCGVAKNLYCQQHRSVNTRSLDATATLNVCSQTSSGYRPGQESRLPDAARSVRVQQTFRSHRDEQARLLHRNIVGLAAFTTRHHLD